MDDVTGPFQKGKPVSVVRREGPTGVRNGRRSIFFPLLFLLFGGSRRRGYEPSLPSFFRNLKKAKMWPCDLCAWAKAIFGIPIFLSLSF